MSTKGENTQFLLIGLEPDNLLAFLSLLGTLISLSVIRGQWLPRVRWRTQGGSVRPVLSVQAKVSTDELLTSVEEGLQFLAEQITFEEDMKDLKLTPGVARAQLLASVVDGTAETWSSLTSDAAMRDGKKWVEPTPLCLLFGQGHQHFLERLASIPRYQKHMSRGRGKSAVRVTGTQTLREALLEPWRRQDNTPSYRWDPAEDVRYAYRNDNPSTQKTKEGTQAGANRLAAIALLRLPVAPVRSGQAIRALCRGSRRGRKLTFSWPVWKEPTTLAGVLALLDGTYEVHQSSVTWYRSERFSQGKFMNWTVGRTASVPMYD